MISNYRYNPSWEATRDQNRSNCETRSWKTSKGTRPQRQHRNPDRDQRQHAAEASADPRWHSRQRQPRPRRADDRHRRRPRFDAVPAFDVAATRIWQQRAAGIPATPTAPSQGSLPEKRQSHRAQKPHDRKTSRSGEFSFIAVESFYKLFSTLTIFVLYSTYCSFFEFILSQSGPTKLLCIQKFLVVGSLPTIIFFTLYFYYFDYDLFFPLLVGSVWKW